MFCRKCKKEIEDGSIFCNYCGTNQEKRKASYKRRGNGQGSVFKVGRSWCCERMFGFDENGKRATVRKSGFRTKTEALDYIQYLKDPRIKAQLRERSPEITLKGLYDLWLPTHEASKGTLDCYRSAFLVFRPLWYVRMCDLDIDDLQDCMNEYTPKKGTGGKRTRQNAKVCLGLIYKYGIPRGYVTANASGDANISRYLKVTGDEGAGRVGFTTEELELIKNAVGTVQYADYILCACYLGFRPSAFLSLNASDYDRKEHALRGGIKTEAGINRTVTVSPKIIPIIERLTRDKAAGYIFCSTDGGKLTLKEYREKFYAALDEIGISNPTDEFGTHRITPHSCRHTFATLIKAVKAPDKDKLELIGHTSEEMLRHYQDVALEDLRKITNAI